MTGALGSQPQWFHPAQLFFCALLVTVSAQTTQNLYTLDILLIFISISWSIDHAGAVYHEHSKAELCTVLANLKCVFRSDGKLCILIY